MRQKGQVSFANVLNNIRFGEMTDDDIELLNKQVLAVENIIPDATVLVAENQPKDKYNS